MQTAEHHREQFELAYATAWAKDRNGDETPEQLAAEIKSWRIGDTYGEDLPRLRFGWEGYQWASAGQCLAQIEEPAQPVLYVSPGQLANHSNPEGPESAKAGRYLPARKTPAGKFTQPLYAGAAPAAVAPQADLDADLGLNVDQRDTAEGWADGLAGLIGKYFGRDIGEHSSAHCPWQEAKDIIEEAEPYQPAAVTGPAWGEQQVHALAIHMAASAPPSHNPRDYDADMAWAHSALGFIAGHATAAPALEAPAAPPVPVDEFRGDTPSLVRNIVALLELDADGALVPHGVGGHARGLLSAAAARLAAAPQAPAAPVLQLPAARAGRIYVAGPMTGLPDHNFPAFNAAAENLRAKGWHVENPAEHGIVEGAEWADYLHYDMGRLATCSAVHLLPGWSKSRGAALEVHVATTLGMPIFYADGAEPVAAAPAAPAVHAPAQVARDAGFNHGVCLALQIMASAGNAGDAEWTELLDCAGREEIMHYARHVETESWLLCGFAAITAQAKEGGESA